MKTSTNFFAILALAGIAGVAEASTGPVQQAQQITVAVEGPAHVSQKFMRNWEVQNAQFWPTDSKGRPYVPWVVMRGEGQAGGEQYIVPIPPATAKTLHGNEKVLVSLPVPAQPAKFIGIAK